MVRQWLFPKRGRIDLNLKSHYIHPLLYLHFETLKLYVFLFHKPLYNNVIVITFLNGFNFDITLKWNNGRKQLRQKQKNDCTALNSNIYNSNNVPFVGF